VGVFFRLRGVGDGSIFSMAIPKKIWQTCNFEEKDIPDYIDSMRHSWTAMNPGWEYQYMSEKDCIEFLDGHYGAKRADAYKKLVKGAYKGDFWRWHCIARFGGVYADIDTECVVPLDSWLDISKNFVGFKDMNGDDYTFCSWFFAAPKESPWISEVADLVFESVVSRELTADGNFFNASIEDTYFTFVNYMGEEEGSEGFTDQAQVLEQIPYGEKRLEEIVRHTSAGWFHSENDSEFREIPESYYWDCGSNVNLKIYNNSYSSNSFPGNLHRG
jgi:hypothetical protein